MAQTVKCDNCGGKQFTNKQKEYYSMRWTFECNDCGAKIEIREPYEEL